jgi:hypothetical protein
MKENEVGVGCGTHGREEKMHKVLLGKPEGKNPLGRPRHDGRMGSEWILGRVARGGMDSVGSG